MKKRKEVTNTTNRSQFPDEEEEDRISLLPDCLIIEILSRLPDTKYAIRTGSLSKRWQHIWTSVYNLIFIFRDQSCIWDDKTSEYCFFIEKTLTQCRQININRFEIQLYHGHHFEFESQFRNWIRYAITRNVKDLVLDLKGDNLEPELVLVDDLFIFNNSSFTCLTLGDFVLNPTEPISWKTLKTLSITNGYLDERSIENILSGSPLLETLILWNCHGYSRLDITSKSIKNLVFSSYFDPFNSPKDIIEINAPYISSLTISYDLWLRKLLLLNVSSLVKAEIDYKKIGYPETTSKEAEAEMLKGFILSLSNVKELKIGMSCLKTFFQLGATGFKFPSNLKVLIHFR